MPTSFNALPITEVDLAALALDAKNATPAGPHLAYLDGLRGAVALFVVLHHA